MADDSSCFSMHGWWITLLQIGHLVLTLLFDPAGQACFFWLAPCITRAGGGKDQKKRGYWSLFLFPFLYLGHLVFRFWPPSSFKAGTKVQTTYEDWISNLSFSKTVFEIQLTTIVLFLLYSLLSQLVKIKIYVHFCGNFSSQNIHLQNFENFFQVWVYKQFYLTLHPVYFNLCHGLLAAPLADHLMPWLKSLLAQILTFALIVMLAFLDLAFVSGQNFSSAHFSILFSAASFFRSIAAGSRLTTGSWHLF